MHNFKGCFLGNPLTYMPYRDYGFYGTAWGHQLLPKTLWDEYMEKDCRSQDTYVCNIITYEMMKTLDGLDLYALDFPVCDLPSSTRPRLRLRHWSRSDGTTGTLGALG